MGNTVESAKFRGMVQILGERTISEQDEIQAFWTEFWSLKLESGDDFYSKFSPQDARDIFERGNGFFLIDQALEKLLASKTACRVLSRLFPAFLASNVSLPSAHLVAPSVITALCEDGIGFDKEREDEEKDVLWARFPGDRESEQDSNQLDDNRVELLRCLVVALSEPLFNKAEHAGEAFQFCFDGLLDESFKNESISERGVNLFVSMLAVVVENKRKDLARHCVNALTVLLDAKSGEMNPLMYVLVNLPLQTRRAVMRGIVDRLVSDQTNLVVTLCLLWRLLDLKEMADALVEEESALCLLAFELSARLFNLRRGEDRRVHAQVQMASILWFVLTCDRRFGLVLNRNAAVPKGRSSPKNFPAVLSKEWTLMDFCFCSVLRFVSEGSSQSFEPLMRLALTGLVNVSWYIKSLHAFPSAALVALIEQRYSKPRFLLAKESNHVYLKSALDIVSNVLQYQSQGNARLIYALMRSRHVFYHLQDWVPTFGASSQVQEDETTKNSESPVVVIAAASNDKEKEQEPAEKEEEEEQQDGSSKKDAEEEEIKEAEIEEETKTKESTTTSTDPVGSGESKPFTPSAKWFNEWRPNLPLSVILLAVKELGPRLDLVASANEEDFLRVIEGTTLVGALPAPPPIIIAKYARSDKIDSVVRRAIWVHLYRSEDYLDLWCVPDLSSAKLASSNKNYEEV